MSTQIDQSSASSESGWVTFGESAPETEPVPQVTTADYDLREWDDDEFTCPKCLGTAPLSDVFCLLCGSLMPPRPTSSFAQNQNKSEWQEMVPQNTGSMGAIPQHAVPPPPPNIGLAQQTNSMAGTSSAIRMASQSKATKSTDIVPLFIVCLMLGLGLFAGVFAGTQQNEKLKKSESPLAIPTRGLTVLTAKPNSEMFIEFPTHSAFILACAGPEGDVTIANDLEAGTYQMSVEAADAHTSFPFTVKDNTATVLGGPPGPELLAGPATTKE